jgi:hypothetical protein
MKTLPLALVVSDQVCIGLNLGSLSSLQVKQGRLQANLAGRSPFPEFNGSSKAIGGKLGKKTWCSTLLTSAAASCVPLAVGLRLI